MSPSPIVANLNWPLIAISQKGNDMAQLSLISNILALVLCVIGASLATWTFARLLIRRWQARKYQQEHLRPAVYEVGSPEHAAQIVEAIYTLNRQLASQGKRIPEKTAIQIIQQVTGTEPEGNNE
jgi:hypothetical protein